MLKTNINLISINKDINLYLFKKTTKDRGLINKYEWDYDLHDISILAEIEILAPEIAGYASSLEKGNFTRCEETLASLSVKSIYDNEIILNWLTLENMTKYPDYYVYILFLENYRSLVVKVCKEMREKTK